jgi:hypothetical protein
MFTSIDTHSLAVIAQRFMLTASVARKRDQGWLHADSTLVGRSLR